MRRRRRRVGGRVHYEVAAVISVLGLAFMGRPLLAGEAVEPALVVRAADLPAAAPAGSLAWFVPGGQNRGTEHLAMALTTVAMEGNEPLYLSGDWGREWGSARSDHHVSSTDSWAVDLAVRGVQRPTPQTDEAARRIATALGHPGWTGGDLKVTIEGYRFQLLWRVAGHFNHVHVGVRKV
jgi:hypothetical protein